MKAAARFKRLAHGLLLPTSQAAEHQHSRGRHSCSSWLSESATMWCFTNDRIFLPPLTVLLTWRECCIRALALHGPWLPVYVFVFTVGRMFTDLPTQVTAYACLLQSKVMHWLCGDHFKKQKIHLKSSEHCPNCCRICRVGAERAEVSVVDIPLIADTERVNLKSTDSRSAVRENVQ